jgi:hypothetical protein
VIWLTHRLLLSFGGNASSLSRAREYQIGAYGCVRYRSFRQVTGLTIPTQRERGATRADWRDLLYATSWVQ